MEQEPTSPRKPRARNPYAITRLTNPQFSKRKKTSRQKEAMKNAVRLVVVGGAPLSFVAATTGHSRQNVLAGVERFIRSTSEAPKRMTAEQFDYASRYRRNKEHVQAARLYLVDGYSYIEVAKRTGVADATTKDMVKRLRASIHRVGGQVPPPGRSEVYTPPDADWQWPTPEEVEALSTSCVVRHRSELTYTRAAMLLALRMAPSEVAKLTDGLLPYMERTANTVVADLNRYRVHMQFPKSVPYLDAMRMAVAHRISNKALRAGVERYLGKDAKLDAAAALAGVTADAMATAIRGVTHEMARMPNWPSFVG